MLIRYHEIIDTLPLALSEQVETGLVISHRLCAVCMNLDEISLSFYIPILAFLRIPTLTVEAEPMRGPYDS